MKNGRTHLAYKAEHAVDMETEAIVAVKMYGADEGDTKTILPTVIEAMEQIGNTAPAIKDSVNEGIVNPQGPDAVVTDKGYHSKEVVRDLIDADFRTYVSEPSRGRQKWPGQELERQVVYANRRRIHGETGKSWLRLRGEKLERWNQLCTIEAARGAFTCAGERTFSSDCCFTRAAPTLGWSCVNCLESAPRRACRAVRLL